MVTSPSIGRDAMCRVTMRPCPSPLQPEPLSPGTSDPFEAALDRRHRQPSLALPRAARHGRHRRRGLADPGASSRRCTHWACSGSTRACHAPPTARTWRRGPAASHCSADRSCARTRRPTAPGRRRRDPPPRAGPPPGPLGRPPSRAGAGWRLTTPGVALGRCCASAFGCDEVDGGARSPRRDRQDLGCPRRARAVRAQGEPARSGLRGIGGRRGGLRAARGGRGCPGARAPRRSCRPLVDPRSRRQVAATLRLAGHATGGPRARPRPRSPWASCWRGSTARATFDVRRVRRPTARPVVRARPGLRTFAGAAVSRRRPWAAATRRPDRVDARPAAPSCGRPIHGRLVVCHRDLHPGNVLVDGTGALVVLDQDDLGPADPARELARALFDWWSDPGPDLRRDARHLPARTSRPVARHGCGSWATSRCSSPPGSTSCSVSSGWRWMWPRTPDDRAWAEQEIDESLRIMPTIEQLGDVLAALEA